MTRDGELLGAVERAIAKSVELSESPHPTVAVKEAVDLVMLESNAGLHQKPAIAQQVCETSLKRRYVLVFLDH